MTYSNLGEPLELEDVKPRHALTGAMAIRDLGSSARHIYDYLAKLADNDTLKCFPSVAAIADDCGYSRRTVFRSLPELESAGYIFIKSGGGGNIPSTYTLNRGKALSMYLEVRRRKQERGQIPGWKSDKAAPPSKPRPPTPEPSSVAESPSATTQTPPAADMPASLTTADLKQLTNEQLSEMIRTDHPLKWDASTELNGRFKNWESTTA